MDCFEVSHLIFVILNGPNHIHWAQVMTNFLHARRVWRIVTIEVTAQTLKKDKSEKDFGDKKEDWIVKNGDIINWFRNTSIPYINQQF